MREIPLLTAIGLAAALLVACDDQTNEIDGGEDAGHDAGGVDAGFDAGPPPTGCHLLEQDGGPEPEPDPLPAPDDFERPSGPGAPSVAFEEADLFEHCAYMPNGETDHDHHNSGFFLDGYLVRPWAHERGGGGIAVWDISSPCEPELVANPLDDQIRENHAVGLSNIGGRFIAVASLRGVQFWDLSTVTEPRLVHDMTLPGVRYPDAYMRVVMAVFWQAPYVYVAGSDNGIFIIDATDPSAPILVDQYQDHGFRTGQIIAIGNLLYGFTSQGSAVGIMDISEPGAPRLIPGGRFEVVDGRWMDRFGRLRPFPAYFAHVSGGLSFHTRQAFGAGLAIFDVSDPTSPELIGDYDAPDGEGGYVFLKEGIAFVGLSHFGLAIDVSNPREPRQVGRFDLVGDLDTITPFGNVVVASVDEDANPGEASAVIPYQRELDTTPPEVNMVVPRDGATEQAISSRVGLTFTEFVEMASVHRGSVVVREEASGRVVEGYLSGQEGVVNFWPVRPLRPSTTYEVWVPANGVTDLNGNPIASEHRSRFTTVSCE